MKSMFAVAIAGVLTGGTAFAVGPAPAPTSTDEARAVAGQASARIEYAPRKASRPASSTDEARALSGSRTGVELVCAGHERGVSTSDEARLATVKASADACVARASR